MFVSSLRCCQSVKSLKSVDLSCVAPARLGVVWGTGILLFSDVHGHFLRSGRLGIAKARLALLLLDFFFFLFARYSSCELGSALA